MCLYHGDIDDGDDNVVLFTENFDDWSVVCADPLK